MHWQYEVCLAELVLVITCQNMCYSYREFWQASCIKRSFIPPVPVPSYVPMLCVKNFTFQNTPNDLQLLSDAPAHHVFALLGPVDPNQTSLPEVLCILQVSWSFVPS